MIEAVENHMPEVIVIDEIGTELEAAAARTIAERGVQLIGTAHGNNLDNLMLNPTLSDLIGGIQRVTLGDEEARRRRTQKSVLERKAPPTFDVVVEIQSRDRVTVHPRRRRDGRRAAARRSDRAGAALARRGRRSTARRHGRGPARRRRCPASVSAAWSAQAVRGWRAEPGWRPGARTSPTSFSSDFGCNSRSAATARVIGPGRPAAGGAAERLDLRRAGFARALGG